MDFAIIVATVLTVYGIETLILAKYLGRRFHSVATVLTVYGIETALITCNTLNLFSAGLQQYLPFTVLKPNKDFTFFSVGIH